MRKPTGGYSDRSVVTIACSSSRGPEFDSQYLHHSGLQHQLWGIWLFCTTRHNNFFCIYSTQMYTQTHTHTHDTHIYTHTNMIHIHTYTHDTHIHIHNTHDTHIHDTHRHTYIHTTHTWHTHMTHTDTWHTPVAHKKGRKNWGKTRWHLANASFGQISPTAIPHNNCHCQMSTKWKLGSTVTFRQQISQSSWSPPPISLRPSCQGPGKTHDFCLGTIELQDPQNKFVQSPDLHGWEMLISVMWSHLGS